jgi:integrase
MPGLRKSEELTNALIEKAPIPPDGARAMLWDSLVPGLGLRIYPTGRKVWIVTYRIKGGPRTQQKATLGPYGRLQGQIPIAAARNQARAIIAKANGGDDPQGESRTSKASPTVATLVSEYMERYAKAQKRSWYSDQKILNANVLPAWGGRRVADVTRRDVIALLDAIYDRGAPIQANRALACIRKMWNWAMSRDMAQASPCAGIKPPAPENRRERVLTDGEIRAVWNACDKLKPPMAAHWRLRLLTAQRGGELLSARWEDVDLDGGLWTIPAAVAKNKRAHRVPLSGPAVEILRGLKAAVGASPWICPGLKGGHVHEISGASKRLRDLSGVEFRPHDLRHTVATNLARLGTPRTELAKILNHVTADRSMTARYDHHEYDGAKRAALDAWAERLMAVVG